MGRSKNSKTTTRKIYETGVKRFFRVAGVREAIAGHPFIKNKFDLGQIRTEKNRIRCPSRSGFRVK